MNAVESVILPHGKEDSDERIESEREFCDKLVQIQEQIVDKYSARGWCYLLEQYGLSKSMFDITEKAINDCRKSGSLPVDFTAEEEGRHFSGIETPDTETPEELIKAYLQMALECEDTYTPDWWDGEEYYIQMVVEKIDLKTLFAPVCTDYHIPIATSKGWASILHRAEYAKRFKKAESQGLKCVFLYCGDHDPDGLRISAKLRKNLMDLSKIHWTDGVSGYNPKHLIIDRFGLNFDFIESNDLTWIDDSHIPPIGVPKLMTGSGKNLADPDHKNFHMDYLQNYIQKYGVRKCEANALSTIRDSARVLCRENIEKYLDDGAHEKHPLDRFNEKRSKIKSAFREVRAGMSIDGISLEKIINEFVGGS